MNSVPITVTIPVGPNPANIRWLSEALQSIATQSLWPAEILLIQDRETLEVSQPPDSPPLRIWKAPWRLGVAHAFNFGVALSDTPLTLMMGSDDRLLPECLAACWMAWREYPDPVGYYHMNVLYSTGLMQGAPCNAAMVTKDLWKLTGGFPIESAVGMPDSILISMILAAQGKLGHLVPVPGGPYYYYRKHPETETEQRQNIWHGQAEAIRNIKTAEAAALNANTNLR